MTDEEREDLTKLVKSIMPVGWNLHEEHSRGVNFFFHYGEDTNRSTSQSIHIVIDEPTKKLTFSGCGLWDLDNNFIGPKDPPIYVSMSYTKKPQAMIADLNRRFWTMYNQQWAEKWETLQAHNKYITDRRNGIHKIAEALNYKITENHDERSSELQPNRGGINKVRYNSPESVELTLESMSFENVLKVIAFLKTINKKGE